MKINAIVKKYLTATKKSLLWSCKTEDTLYLSDGCSILKVALNEVNELGREDMPNLYAMDTGVVYKGLQVATETVELFTRILETAEEKSAFSAIFTGFSKKEVGKTVDLYSYINDNDNYIPWAIDEKYHKIILAIGIFPPIVSGKHNPGLVIDAMAPKNCKVEFLVCPVRLADDFFKPILDLYRAEEG